MTDQLVYGLHAVKALLVNPLRTTYKLYINKERSDERLNTILSLAENKKIPIETLSLQGLNKQFNEVNHQGVVASAKPLPEYTDKDLAMLFSTTNSPKTILILDGITDPHNLGACLRTADATGVNFVIIPKDKNASLTAIVSKVACGAAEAIPLIRVTNLVRTIEWLKEQGVWIYGAAGEATQTIYQLDFSSPVAIILGAEDKGLRRLTREHCDNLFSLPMIGTVESLNVSVATGVTLYEVIRQRHHKVQHS